MARRRHQTTRANLASAFKPWPATATSARPTSETGLYLVDNGACRCAAHLGASASMTGRDISGQPIHPLSAADCLEATRAYGVTFRCELCRVGSPIRMIADGR